MLGYKVPASSLQFQNNSAGLPWFQNCPWDQLSLWCNPVAHNSISPLPHPTACAPLRMLFPRALLLHQLRTCKSPTRACFLRNSAWTAPRKEQSPGSHETRQRAHSPTSETLEALRTVLIGGQYTVWHQMRDPVRISRVFNRKTPAVAKGRAPRTPPPCCLC